MSERFQSAGEVLESAAVAAEALGLPKQHQMQALQCTSRPLCSKVCGRCRVRIFRMRQFYDQFENDDVFADWLQSCRDRDVQSTYADGNRYIAALRRRNTKPHPKITAPVCSEDREWLHATCKALGVRMKDYIAVAVLMADPDEIAEVLRAHGRVKATGDST